MKTELMNAVIALRPAVLGTIALTLVMAVFTALRLRKIDLRGGGSHLATLFVGLGGRSLLHLAAAWVKFAFFTAVLLLAQPAPNGHFWLLGALCALTLVMGCSRKMLVNELLCGGALLAGLLLCRLLLNYLRQIRYDGGIRFVYWLLAVFLIAAAAGLLVREATLISGERNEFDESGETE